MRLARCLILAALLPIIVCAQAAAVTVPTDTTHVLELDEGWEYAPLSGIPVLEDLPDEWQSVDLPHLEGLDDNALYRVRFPVPAVWSRENVEVVVRCPKGIVRVWLNGQAAGTRPGTALDARFDVSDHFRRGEVNTLLIAIEAPAWLRRGPLEACWVEATPAAAIAELRTAARPLGERAVLDVWLSVRNRTREKLEGRLELALEPDLPPGQDRPVQHRHNDVNLDPGRSGDAHHVYEIERPRLWRFDAPHLYKLTVVLRDRRGGKTLHTVERRIGMRTLAAAGSRWVFNGEWVRLAGVALPAPGAAVLCTRPGQATALVPKLLAQPRLSLDELLTECDRQGIGAWLEVPALDVAEPGCRETLDALAALTWHPSVWGCLIVGEEEHVPIVVAHLRASGTDVPVGRHLPKDAAAARHVDFVLSRFRTEALPQYDKDYWRRLDRAQDRSARRAVAVLDVLSPPAAGDRTGVGRSMDKRRPEAAKRAEVGMLFFQLPCDAPLLRNVEGGWSPFWLKPPRCEARRDKRQIVVKSHLECGVQSPVAKHIPAYSMDGDRLRWTVSSGTKQVAGGRVEAPVIRPRPIEGHGPNPLRRDAEWRIEKPRKMVFTVDLESPGGRRILGHTTELTLKAGRKGKINVRAAPPPKAPEPQLVHLDIGEQFNNDGISTQAVPRDGNFDLPERPSGSTYPAEHLPDGGKPFEPGSTPGVSFRFPPTADGKDNNIRCQGQRLDAPPGAFRTLWLLAAAETGDQQGTVHLVYPEGEQTALVRLTDWCREPRFGEREAVRCPERRTWQGEAEAQVCRIWAVPLPLRSEPLRAIVLPENPRIHIFAVTLVRAPKP